MAASSLALAFPPYRTAMIRLAPAFALLLVAGCARSEDPTYVQVDTNQGYNQAGRVGAPEQDDQEPAIGQWRASLQENAPALEFGPMGTEPLLSLLCTGRQSVLIQRHGGAPAGPVPDLQLSIAGRDVRLPVTAGGGTVQMLRADVPLNHPIVTALGEGSQPLTMRLGDDAAPVIIPGSPLVRDYLRSCTTAQPLPPANGSQTNAAAPQINGAATVPAGNAAAPVTTPPANAAQTK
jgi:hypothetical protein